jgi:hypothetical protein
MMKSLRLTAFEPRLKEVQIPEPGEGEALVRVKAARICPQAFPRGSVCLKLGGNPKNPATAAGGH